MEMLLFFGRKDKDTITARLFIDRIKTAARIANWDDARKLSEIYLVLCDRAIIWWNSLEDASIARDNWNAVKNEFLASYKPRYTAKITCANFTELTQRQGEGVHDYYLRVHNEFFKMFETKTADIATLRVVPANIATLAVPVAAADLTKCKREGIQDAEKFFKHQLFLAGLNEPIRGKVMEANKETCRSPLNLRPFIKNANEVKLLQSMKKTIPSPPRTTKPTTILGMTKSWQLMQSVNGKANRHSDATSVVCLGKRIRLMANPTSLAITAKRRAICSANVENASLRMVQ